MRQRRRITVAAPSVVVPDAPTLTAPADESDVYDGVAVAWTATVTAGQVPDRIDLVLDPGGGEVVVATDSTAAYGGNWTPTGVTPGAHTLVARFVYGSGSVDSAAVNVVLFEADTISALELAFITPTGITLNGSDVLTWTDSKSSYAVTQATPSKQPAYGTDAGYGGRYVLTLVRGDSQLLEGTALFGAALTQPNTIYVVGNVASSDAAAQEFCDGGAAARNIIYVAAGATTASIYGGAALNSATAVTDPCVMAAVFNGASSALYKNDHTTAIATGDAGALSLDSLAIGGQRGSGSGNLSGKVGAVLVYSGAHDEATRLRVMNFLGAFFGIAVT